jgi:hypothetical protein
MAGETASPRVPYEEIRLDHPLQPAPGGENSAGNQPRQQDALLQHNRQDLPNFMTAEELRFRMLRQQQQQQNQHRW